MTTRIIVIGKYPCIYDTYPCPYPSQGKGGREGGREGPPKTENNPRGIYNNKINLDYAHTRKGMDGLNNISYIPVFSPTPLRTRNPLCSGYRYSGCSGLIYPIILFDAFLSFFLACLLA